MEATLNSLTEAELAIARSAEPDALAELDEDALLELHGRVRRARNKYLGQYRRRAAASVGGVGGRGKAHAQNQRARDKAEVLETALAPSSSPSTSARSDCGRPASWVPHTWSTARSRTRAEKIKRLGGADSVVVTAASPKPIAQASLARGGTPVFVGLPAENEAPIPIFRSVAGVAICLEHLILDAAPRRDTQSVGPGPCAHSGGVDAVGRRTTGVGRGAATRAPRPRSPACWGRPRRLGPDRSSGVAVPSSVLGVTRR